MNNFGGVICGICLNYFLHPVTAKCSHSFCQMCLDQYFVYFSSCPQCEKQIRNHKTIPARSLASFTQNFIVTQDEATQNQYQFRNNTYKIKKQDRLIKQYKAGMKVDIRDNNYQWRQGIIMRIISRVGQPNKYLKIRYLCQDKQCQFYQKEQELIIISQRLANYGFYTARFYI